MKPNMENEYRAPTGVQNLRITWKRKSRWVGLLKNPQLRAYRRAGLSKGAPPTRLEPSGGGGVSKS